MKQKSSTSVVAATVLAILFCLTLAATAQSGTWKSTGSMNTSRYAASAVLLRSGRVLVVGGINVSNVTASAEIYDPVNGSWSATGSLSLARAYALIVALPNGKVLLAGGCTSPSCSAATSSAEIYDPSTGLWAKTAAMAQIRYYSVGTLLPGGQVLVEGGCSAGDCNTSTNTAELYNSASGKWTYTGKMTYARDYHTATLLPNGKVLVVGGFNPSGTSEVYDPASKTWTLAGTMLYPHALHTATLLGNGKVLLAGGMQSYTPGNFCELYDPASNSWSATGALNTKRDNQGGLLLANGKALVVGGNSYSRPKYYKLASAELYDATAGTWSFTGSMSVARYLQSTVILSNGQVLVAGGLDSVSATLASAELYTP